MRLDSFLFGALCVMSGGRLPAALFMVFLLDSKGAKVFRSYRVKSFPFTCKIGVDTAENEPSKILQIFTKLL